MKKNRLKGALIRTKKSQKSGIIAFCGTRGLPANYGGFETAVDQISKRFIEQGYSCEVFCRESSFTDRKSEDKGRKLTYVKGSKFSRFDTFISAIQTGFKLFKNRKKYKHVFWFNNANLPGIILTRLACMPMSVNTDGLEWRRAKWSPPFKLYYWLSSLLVTILCKSVITDSKAIQKYYREKFYKDTQFIPYGAPEISSVSEREQDLILAKYNLKKGRYFLQITRIEPDNLPLKVAEAFYNSGLGLVGDKMLIVGYKESTPYAQRLIAYNGKNNIKISNAVYDQKVLYALRKNCFCYVHGNSVGGTNPALLEAMSTCPRVMAIDCEFSREVLGNNGIFFDPENIEASFHEILSVRDMSETLKNRIMTKYVWDAVAKSYVNLAERKNAFYNMYLHKYSINKKYESESDFIVHKY